MYEFSLATEIVESVREFARHHANSRVLTVRAQIGELTGVEPEPLRFCYEAITRQTPLEGSRLEIEMVAASIHCPRCAYDGPPTYWEDNRAGVRQATLQCPKCGATGETTRGHECLVTTVQVYDPEPFPTPPLRASPGTP